MDTVGIASGDRRLSFLYDRLIQLGVSCKIILEKDELDPKKPFKGIILGLPTVGKDGLIGGLGIGVEQLPEYICEGGFVVCGKLSAEYKEYLSSEGLKVVDYYDDELTTEIGAVATAEGTLHLITQELPTTIMGSNMLIVGYGRIGRCLERILRGYGARVTVVARNPLARYKAAGFGARAYANLMAIGQGLEKYDCVINTVPTMMIDEEVLNLLKDDVLIIDLASIPGGVDFKAAMNMGIRTLWALKLPEKYAPASVADGILTLLATELASELFCKKPNKKGD